MSAAASEPPPGAASMIQHDLVDQEHWIANDRFNRTLAVYQVHPGPEAHELCVYFATLARGRLVGIFAGLGFRRPGFKSASGRLCDAQLSESSANR
jgi:chromate transporter